MVRTAAALLLCAMTAACASAPPAASPMPPEVNEKDPLAATQLMQQGRALVEQGKFAEGMARYQLAARLQPANPTVHNLIGLAELSRSNPSAAVAAFNRALVLAPTYSDARNNRAAAYLQLGQMALAEQDFLQVLGDLLYANRAGVFFNLGALYLAQGNLLAAEENLRKGAVPSGPVEAYLLLAQVHQRHSRLDEAEQTLRDGMARAPERADVALALAVLLRGRGQADEARSLFERVLVLAPSSPEAAEARTFLRP